MARASHEQAAEAMDELEAKPEGANGVALWYNDRDYMQRGWVSFPVPSTNERARDLCAALRAL